MFKNNVFGVVLLFVCFLNELFSDFQVVGFFFFLLTSFPIFLLSLSPLTFVKDTFIEQQL